MKKTARTGARPRVGILSPCGTGNLGDEATVAVLIQEIRRRSPDADIFGLTTNPDDTRKLHGIPAYPTRNITAGTTPPRPAATAGPARRETATPPQRAGLGQTVTDALKQIPVLAPALRAALQGVRGLRNVVSEGRFIARSLKQLKGTDLLIVAGSGQLLDNYRAVWGFPYTLLKWSLMARICGTRLGFVSCGAGPIDLPLSKRFIRWALALADYRSFRDRESRELIRSIGFRSNDDVTPDLVFSADFGRVRHNGTSKVVAINPLPNHDPRYAPKNSESGYANYVNRLAAFAAWLIREQYTVVLFPTQLRADPLVIKDVQTVLREDKTLDLDRYLRVMAVSGLDDLLDQLSGADLVVASRFHGVLISFLLQKPVLGLSHHPKVSSLMKDMGQSEYLMDIDQFTQETIVERFSALAANRAAIRQQIGQIAAANRRTLESQYDRLFGTLFNGDGAVEAVRDERPVLN